VKITIPGVTEKERIANDEYVLEYEQRDAFNEKVDKLKKSSQ
jgi:hypothetical protein